MWILWTIERICIIYNHANGYWYITEELDNGNFYLGIFIDLSKASETVDHKLKLTTTESEKLLYHGQLIISFVVANVCFKYPMLPVTCGVKSFSRPTVDIL